MQAFWWRAELEALSARGALLMAVSPFRVVVPAVTARSCSLAAAAIQATFSTLLSLRARLDAKFFGFLATVPLSFVFGN